MTPLSVGISKKVPFADFKSYTYSVPIVSFQRIKKMSLYIYTLKYIFLLT